MATTAKEKAESQARKGQVAAGVSKHDELGLNKEQLLEMYYYMLLARSLAGRTWLLNRQGKAPFVISCQGHAALPVGAGFALARGTDWLLPYYLDLVRV